MRNNCIHQVAFGYGTHVQTFRARGVYVDIAVERLHWACPGGHMDTNRIFTNLFGGWLTAADKAAATTINYTKSTVMPSFSGLTRKATMATGKTLLAAGYKLVDCCTRK